MMTAAPIRIETDAPALQEAEQRVRAGWARYRASNKDRASAVVETGQQLQLLKAGCAHGTWGPMLDSIDIPHRTARDWMTLAKTATVAVLEEHGIRGTLERVRAMQADVTRLGGIRKAMEHWTTEIKRLEAECAGHVRIRQIAERRLVELEAEGGTP